jgi:hypothetical protein
MNSTLQRITVQVDRNVYHNARGLMDWKLHHEVVSSMKNNVYMAVWRNVSENGSSSSFQVKVTLREAVNNELQ